MNSQDSSPFERDLGQHCQSIYWNLVELLHQKTANQIDVLVYSRELMETARCDKFYDLKNVRESMEQKVGPDVWSKIKEFAILENTEQEKTIRALAHDYDWQKNILKRALSWPNWAYYHTIFHVKSTLCTVGIFSASHGIYRFARKNSH